MSWSDFVQGSGHAGHGVQIYRDVDELAGSVAEYFAAGFANGEPGVLVATAEHAACFHERLAAAGWDRARIDDAGLLVTADADETLAFIIESDVAPATAFKRVVGGLLDRAIERSPGRRPRVFGEMVNLLYKRGEAKSAVALEELWNDLARTRDFSLLCGYGVDVFDRSAQAGALPEICRVHSHVLPAQDPARLARAVDRALAEVLGPAEAGRVYVLVGEQARRERVPAAQLILMWVSANIPALADRILASARTHYAAESAPSAA